MKKLLISLGAISSVVGISTTVISCGKSETKKPVNSTGKESNNVSDVDKFDALLDLTAENIIEVELPKFAEEALNALMEKVFTARSKGFDEILSNVSSEEILSQDKILNAISKTAFESIYNINLGIKSTSGFISISLGDLLLGLLDFGEENTNTLANLLDNADSKSITKIISILLDLFKKSNKDLATEAVNLLTSAFSPLINGGQTDQLMKNLSGILPSGLSISLDDGVILTGLLDKIQNKIIKDFDKVKEMQGKTFDEIADNATYRRVATGIFGMRISGILLKSDISFEAFDILKIIYKAANNKDISKEEFISVFSSHELYSLIEIDKFASFLKMDIERLQSILPRIDVKSEFLISHGLMPLINNGNKPSELLGEVVGSYVDIGHFNIPELQWGRGAGQLGENEQKLATKISELLADKGSKLADLIGFKTKSEAEIAKLKEASNEAMKVWMEALKSHMDKKSEEFIKILANKDKASAELKLAEKDIISHKSIVAIMSILGLYAMPQVNNVYTTPSLSDEQTTKLVTKLYSNYLNTIGQDLGYIKNQVLENYLNKISIKQAAMGINKSTNNANNKELPSDKKESKEKLLEYISLNKFTANNLFKQNGFLQATIIGALIGLA